MVDDLAWQIEQIPDSCIVYMRAHRDYFKDGQLQPGVFRKRENGMSVDWGKYSSATEARSRSRIPHSNAVIRLAVGGILRIEPLRVVHSPDVVRGNRAHADISGLPTKEELTEIRLSLLDLAKTVIGIDVDT